MKISLVFICFFLLLNTPVSSQPANKDFHLLFYNLENLFDTRNNPDTEDDEFTPQGMRRWTYKRFYKKITAISKVILSASGWTPPELIAVCEVENRYVLERLLKDTPLKAYPYRIIHKESPDPRGIDVALLYNFETFYPLKYEYIPLKKDSSNTLRSREILYVQGILGNRDTLHLFINHWPSRYSGLLESREARTLAAVTLRAGIQSVQKVHRNPMIIITGDFNDQPSDESLRVHLQANALSENPSGDALFNLSSQWLKDEIKTLKHQSQWFVFDQFIVSGTMLRQEEAFYIRPEFASIVKLPFLLEKDGRYGNYKLNRTYIGFRYHGGFSDHLPVLLKITENL